MMQLEEKIGNEDKTIESHIIKQGADIDPEKAEKWDKAAALVLETDKKIEAILDDVGVGGLANMKNSIHTLQIRVNDFGDSHELKKAYKDIKLLNSKSTQLTHEFQHAQKDIQKINNTLFKLSKCPTMEQFQIVRNRIDQVENFMERTKKKIDEFERKIKMMGGNKNPNQQASP